MNDVLKMLKGGMSLDDAVEARVAKIVDFGNRRLATPFVTLREDGYSQAVLYPEYAAERAAEQRTAVSTRCVTD